MTSRWRSTGDIFRFWPVDDLQFPFLHKTLAREYGVHVPLLDFERRHLVSYMSARGTRANEAWQPTPGERLGVFRLSAARRGCTLR